MSEQTNVYATPKADLGIRVAENSGLAERKQRLFAAMVDGLIGLVVAIPFIIFVGPYLGLRNLQSQPGYSYLIPATIFGFVMFVLMHGYLLHKNGQTLGKKLLNIKIVSIDDTKVTFAKLILFRYLPISLITIVPIVGNFLPAVDALFIFRKDRRCIHDLIAGTKVIKA